MDWPGKMPSSAAAWKMCVLFVTLGIPTASSLDFEMMESLCGSTISVDPSFHMDSSTGITYRNLLDCTLTVTAPSGQYVLALVTRFELEPALTGTCPDYLQVYDGTDTSTSELTSGRLCGSGASVPANFTSTGESMTLHLVTDNGGVYIGFNMVFVAVYDAPCTGGDFLCDTSICIKEELACDGYDQCGDNSDEANCAANSSSSGLNVVMIVVICLVAVTAISLAVAYAVYRVYDRNKWKKFLNAQGETDFTDAIVEPGPSYPITHKYYKGVRGHLAYDSNMTTQAVDTPVLQDERKQKLTVESSDVTPSTSSAVI